MPRSFGAASVRMRMRALIRSGLLICCLCDARPLFALATVVLLGIVGVIALMWVCAAARAPCALPCCRILLEEQANSANRKLAEANLKRQIEEMNRVCSYARTYAPPTYLVRCWPVGICFAATLRTCVLFL